MENTEESKCRVVFWIDKNGLNVSNQSHHWKLNQLDDRIQYPEQQQQEQQYTFTPREAAAAAIYPRAAAAAISLKFHQKHLKNENKTKHFIKISHINVNIYDKTAKSQPNSEKSWKIQKKTVKRYGKYGRKASRIVIRYGKMEER